MATPEERKAKLQAARQSRGLPSLPTYSKSTGTEPLESKRRSNLISNRIRSIALASALALQPSPLNQQSQNTQTTSHTTEQQTSDETELNQARGEEQSRLASMLQRSIMQRTAKQQAQQQQEQQVSEETRKEREKLKQTAKSAVKRGAIFVVDLLAGALDLSSFGISFIVDVFLYAFTLGWLNLEMIYGRYFAKGKSRFISPLSWDPIPMPVDKNALILSGFVVMADIAVVIALLVMGFGSFCIVHDMELIKQSAMAAAQIGAALAQGQTGGLCLSGILPSNFGL